ncbi:MAG: hypothetical protein ABUS57_02745 [Pseudomonadota bacterium]
MDNLRTAEAGVHEVIAEASCNSALLAIVQMLWDARSRSPQYRYLTRKVRAVGVTRLTASMMKSPASPPGLLVWVRE